MNNQNKIVKEILLVEDNAADVLLTKQAFANVNFPYNLSSVTDGVHAMSFLRKQGKYSDAPRPDLVLLDLNLPIKDGREVLAEVKKDDKLRCIPIVVLTTSAREADIKMAYNLSANSYIVKPMDFSQFCDAIKSLQDFWFNTATLPAEC